MTCLLFPPQTKLNKARASFGETKLSLPWEQIQIKCAPHFLNYWFSLPPHFFPFFFFSLALLIAISQLHRGKVPLDDKYRILTDRPDNDNDSACSMSHSPPRNYPITATSHVTHGVINNVCAYDPQ